MVDHTGAEAPFTVIDSPIPDPYRQKVVYTYDDPPEMWRKALGDTLLFEWGLYDDVSVPQPDGLGAAGMRFFNRQLELANLQQPEHPRLQRILDLGCGWGFITQFLACRFPECPRIDAINISTRQLEYCATYLANQGFADRINLYLCDGQDVDLLPDPDQPYDLVVIRGVYTHFRNDVYETSVRALAKRVSETGTVIISDTLFKGDLSAYRSAIPDEVDRVACANRKTPEYFARVLSDNGFTIQDMRVLPSNQEIIRWFQDVKFNIEKYFPDGVAGPLEELRVMADNMSVGLAADKVSAYSIVATPGAKANGGNVSQRSSGRFVPVG
jgi:cyclopropane fatty-acyl-phospholipid synthase-like methyltransferase